MSIQDEINTIFDDVREFKTQREKAQAKIDEIQDEIDELEKSKHPFEDAIEGYDDDIKGARETYLSLFDQMTDDDRADTYVSNFDF